jgi:hypothetical protein
VALLSEEIGRDGSVAARHVGQPVLPRWRPILFWHPWFH